MAWALERKYRITSCRAGVLALAIPLFLGQAFPARAQTPLSLAAVARLAAAHAPEVNTGTLLAFASYESQLRPFAIHDNTTGQSVFPASASEAVALANTLRAVGHSLDLGIMQVNSANLARTGLTLAAAFDPGESLRAGAMILIAAYRQCSRGESHPDQAGQQAALRCAASVYNTGREQAGILNGYQPRVWRAAAQIVPAIQFATSPVPPPAAPADTVAPAPRRPPPGLEDALHATPPVPDSGDGLSDALHHLTRGKDTP